MYRVLVLQQVKCGHSFFIHVECYPRIYLYPEICTIIILKQRSEKHRKCSVLKKK